VLEEWLFASWFIGLQPELSSHGDRVRETNSKFTVVRATLRTLSTLRN
jgi:hypothetical protein